MCSFFLQNSSNKCSINSLKYMYYLKKEIYQLTVGKSSKYLLYQVIKGKIIINNKFRPSCIRKKATSFLYSLSAKNV